MRKQIITALSSTILGVTCLMGLPSLALAVDGVILIDQNRVIAAGGFPYRINQPGSYQLAGNLTVPNLITDAIKITAYGVTLNLNGFMIKGPAACDPGGGGGTCTPSPIGWGVISTTGGSTIINGTVTGMGAGGISCTNCRVENMLVTMNAGDGISALSGSIVSDNRSSDNGGYGLKITSFSGYAGNIFDTNVAGNVQGGIQTGSNICGNTLCP